MRGIVQDHLECYQNQKAIFAVSAVRKIMNAKEKNDVETVKSLRDMNRKLLMTNISQRDALITLERAAKRNAIYADERIKGLTEDINQLVKMTNWIFEKSGKFSEQEQKDILAQYPNLVFEPGKVQH